ncbi:MAG: hypothetical protein MHM6MM_003858 [Cercozoa sp. M6MM]
MVLTRNDSTTELVSLERGDARSDENLAIVAQYGIVGPAEVYRNAPPALLYKLACQYESDQTQVSSSGALCALSGERMGRSPAEKRIVKEPTSQDKVWWESDACRPLPERSFDINRERAIDWLSTKQHLFVFDGFAGWDSENQIKVRVIASRAYHALFMHNMLIRPTPEQLVDFGKPDVTIFEAGDFPANRNTDGMSSKCSVTLHLQRRELVILGTEYAGEMKKGVFSFMHYLMPLRGHLSMHASCNVSLKDGGNAAVFFGLSGTGKTTLSADTRRALIGDDEHVWTDKGVFNIEGGCYAKVINLDAEAEPLIFNAIRFGSVLENVVLRPDHSVDFANTVLTLNTRCSYPIEYIPNANVPCLTESHPHNIIFLTCDAFGVLPPVSQLSPEQAMYYFINGYTAKVAGTEVGVKEPRAAFSACFGEAFLVYHPSVYAELLAKKMKQHGARAWLVNTGWTGGAYGTGHRMPIRVTRAIIDAIHEGTLADVPHQTLPVMKLQVPTEVPEVDSSILMPRNTWASGEAYDAQLLKLAKMFDSNFDKYRAGSSEAIINAGPELPN